MNNPVTTESGARAVSAADADHSLAVLARHALTVRAGTTPAPTSVTVANGPVSLLVSWEGGGSSQQFAAEHAGGSANGAGSANGGQVAPGAVAPNGSGAGNLAAGDASSGESTSQTATFTLAAETVGVFYHASEPGASPFVAEGDPVRAGQQVGIVEAMKLMIPVTATKEGVVAEILVGDGEAVEHGQALIVFEALR
ncbi:acetyl-CoA carboxylase biotin carboxyl carrier protein [Nocardia jejuensis]|uniref:acetyl-CoA carboxylase biotin carboxyl carrier protein n=1 Tax=Nocardia jejuensis TaxID=328049 RepID=UPI00082F8A64|nr:acetyl-CoA carboxylase biotin carboxyl carrier protein subunit [Nocardia jejuensis]